MSKAVYLYSSVLVFLFCCPISLLLTFTRFKTDVIYSGGMNPFPAISQNKYPFFLQSVSKMSVMVMLLMSLLLLKPWN
jgi:hypothetical protein